MNVAMVTPLELGIVLLAIIALLVAIRYRTTIKALAINAIFGLIVLAVANYLGAAVSISIWAVLVCAIAGVPGAILVIILAYLDIAFVGMLVI